MDNHFNPSTLQPFNLSTFQLIFRPHDMYFNCHSYYSLRYGTMTVERLSELAAAAGVQRLVLTDINNTTGVPDFVRECRSRDITPAAGIEFRAGNQLLYVGIARNNEGFRELNEFLTHHNFTGEPLPSQPPSFPNAYIIYPAGGADRPGSTGASGTAVPAILRDNEYLGIRPTAAGRLLSTTKKQISKCVVTSARYNGIADRLPRAPQPARRRQ